MVKFKKFLAALIASLACGSLVYFTILPAFIKAQEDDVNLHIKLEASLDNGATWHNYSGTEYSEGETINADPGDTVLMRIKIWNTGTDNAGEVVSSGTLTNYNYVKTIELVSADADGNGESYTLGSEMESGAIALVVNGGTEECTAESGSECATLNFVLSGNFPIGETIIISEIYIDSYQSIRVGLPYNFIRETYAIGLGRKSAVRIAVRVAEPEVLPQTGAEVIK